MHTIPTTPFPTGEKAAHCADRAIVLAAQAGCHDAFTTLFDRYQAPILRYLTRQTGDGEQAADLTQQTFLDAYRRLDRLTGDRPFAAWLYRIAHNNLLHAWRQQRIRQMASLDRLLEEGGTAQRALQQADSTAQVHERELIGTVLNSLTPALREPLLLFCLHGFSSAAVAATLGISPEAARQRIARAREQFRHHYRLLDDSALAATA